jgi:hypothetical protein
LNTQVFNQLPVVEPKHAPETVRESPPAGSSPISYGEQPPALDPAVVRGPVVVDDRLEVRATSSKAPIEISSILQSPPPSNTSIPIREMAVIQLQSLIAAFQEVEDYDPRLHHNGARPALWTENKDYLSDVKALLHELRRLNELLASRNTPDPAKIEKTGGAIADAAKRISDSAYDTIGKGLGYVILGSIGAVLIQLGVPVDVGQLVMSAVKGGK